MCSNLSYCRSSYTEDTIRNAIVASVRSHAKIAIRVIGYDSSLAAMIDQLENRFSAKETTDILLQELNQMMMYMRKYMSLEVNLSINSVYYRRGAQGDTTWHNLKIGCFMV